MDMTDDTKIYLAVIAAVTTMFVATVLAVLVGIGNKLDYRLAALDKVSDTVVQTLIIRGH